MAGGARVPYLGPAVKTGERVPYLGDTTTAPTHHGGGGLFGGIKHAAGSVGHVVAKTTSGLASDFENLPEGLVQVGGGIGQDAEALAARAGSGTSIDKAALAKDPKVFGNTRTIGREQIHQTAESFEHPLRHPDQTLLNTVAIASGGAGALAKAGDIGARAGLIADTSRLANLGKATDLTAPDFAARAGQDGTDVVIKRSSTKPLTKGAQVLVNKGMNALPHDAPVLGSDARIVRTLAKEPTRSAARMTIAQQPFEEAFNKLTNPEKVAWHLKAQAVHPDDYKTFLEGQKNPSPGTLKLLSDPKVARAFDHPTPRLQSALDEGRKLSDHLGAMKVAAGHVSESAVAERPYQLLRQVNGAEVKSLTADNAERLAGRDAAVEKGHLGWVDKPGRDIPTLAKELADSGHEQPFYVPHSDQTKSTGVYRNKPPSGFSAPPLSGTTKQNLGVLARQGKLALHENPLLHEWTKMRGHVEAQQLHDALVEHAAELPKGQPLPQGYEYLKINRGESSASHTEQIGSRFEHAIDPKFVDNTFTRDEHDPDIATGKGDSRLVVPSKVKEIVADRQVKTPGKLYRMLYQKPSSLWKHVIIGLRPASAANITVGNSVLGLLQSAPGHGVEAWLNQVLPGLRGSKVTDATMNDVFPEQKLGTFGRSVSGADRGRVSRALHEKAPRAMNVASKAYQGVMPATIKYESVLRRAMVEGWAKHTPEVRAAMKEHGGDINAALHDIAKSHPQIINDISKKTDDALGDYHSYNAAERTIQQLIPFYGWDRHVVRSLARMFKEQPLRMAAVGHTGQIGQEKDQGLGALPSFLHGAIKLPGLPKFMGPENGRTPLLDTRSLNPFATAADLAGILGSKGSSEIASGLNPFVQSGIEQLTGSSLLTGAPLPKSAVGQNVPSKLWKIAEGTAEGVPQVTLAKAAMQGPQSKPNSLYQNDWQSLLAQILGAKIKKTNLSIAHGEAHRGR